MSDLDHYLGRRLKNWAAMHPPPKDGRAALIAAAAATPHATKGDYSYPFFKRLMRLIILPPFDYLPYEYALGPLAQPRIRSINISASWRLAT